MPIFCVVGEHVSKKRPSAQLLRGIEDLQHVLRSDDKGPTRPERAGGHQGEVLGERKTICRTEEITNTGDDEKPL